MTCKRVLGCCDNEELAELGKRTSDAADEQLLAKLPAHLIRLRALVVRKQCCSVPLHVCVLPACIEIGGCYWSAGLRHVPAKL